MWVQMYSSKIVMFEDDESNRYILAFNKPNPKINLVKTIIKRLVNLQREIIFSKKLIERSRFKLNVNPNDHMQKFLIRVYYDRIKNLNDTRDSYIQDFENHYGHLHILYHDRMSQFDFDLPNKNIFDDDKMEEIEYF